MQSYIYSCEICTHTKTLHTKPLHLLQPQPTPGQPWYTISVDFSTDLLLILCQPSRLVVGDFLTNIAHISGLALRTPQLVRLHGYFTGQFPAACFFSQALFQTVDHNSSNFWRELLKLLDIQPLTLSATNQWVDKMDHSYTNSISCAF